MEIHLVGGAVRDRLLGLPVKDRDWVVVGATPQQMLDAGFKPVGRDFPVFIHPDSGEEYALARTERKSGKGYTGFDFHASPEVTLEEDLRRRDLTINALAQASDGRIIDPYGGQQDLQRRILRHVSPAFVEDPLRVLRVARFAARFAPQGFRVAEETLELMRRLSAGDELEHLSPERVWQEFHRALASAAPLTFIRLLDQVGACAKLLPELCALPTDAEAASQRLWQAGGDADQQFALLLSLASQTETATAATAMIEAFCRRLRVPNRCRDLALQLRLYHQQLCDFARISAEQRLQLIKPVGPAAPPPAAGPAAPLCPGAAQGAPHRPRAGAAAASPQGCGATGTDGGRVQWSSAGGGAGTSPAAAVSPLPWRRELSPDRRNSPSRMATSSVQKPFSGSSLAAQPS